MRIVKELLETLKMELGIIKQNTIEPSITVDTLKNVDVLIYPELFEEKISTSVESIEFSRSNVNTNEISLNSSENLKVTPCSSFLNMLKIESESLRAEESNIRTADFKSSQFTPRTYDKEPFSFNTNSPYLLKEENISKIYSLSTFTPTIFEKKGTLKFSFKIKVDFLYPILVRTYYKEQYVEKELFVKNMGKLIEKYGKDFSFRGYYRNIPLNLAKKVVIEYDRIIMYFDEKRLKEKPILKDFFLIQREQKYVLEYIN